MDGIIYGLNLNLSMDLRVRSRSPVTFKAKFYVTTVITVSSHYLFSVTKSSNFCALYLVKANPFDFIKHNVIQKLAYKVKCIS